MTLKNTDKWHITVINNQMMDGECDTVNESGNGTFREKDGNYFIVYKNGETTGMIKAQTDAVSVKRIGETQSHMIFRQGKATECEYNTQYGKISMDIFTRELKNELSSSGGILKLKYVLKSGGSDIFNDMIIKVRKA